MDEVNELQKAMNRLRTLDGDDLNGLFQTMNTVKEDHRRKSVIDRSLRVYKRQNLTRSQKQKEELKVKAAERWFPTMNTRKEAHEELKRNNFQDNFKTLGGIFDQSITTKEFFSARGYCVDENDIAS